MRPQQMFSRLFQTSASRLSSGRDFLKVSDEVLDAVAAQKAVVALESTIITHGMPYPHNLSTALSVERKVRENGGVPATTAILNGKLCVGLSDSDLMWLAEKSSSLVKVSRRDLSYVLSRGLSGGTTVSATMIAAHMVGIPIFATGGIGGVHRGAETSFDVSADLTELGRTPVTVVSSGIKSILDIPKTLEYLETQGVPVSTFSSDKKFPAFFTRDSGCLAPYNLSTHVEAAQMIDSQMKAGLQTGMLIAVPVPEQFAATGKVIQAAVDQAVQMAQDKKVTGKEVTPFILSRVNELTEGESLSANIALVENNASVAAGIAYCLSQLHQNIPADKISPLVQTSSTSQPSSSSEAVQTSRSESSKSQTAAGTLNIKTSVDAEQRNNGKLSGRPVVIGTTVVDFSVQVNAPNLQFNGASYPGQVSQSFGGVGRNLADCLSRLDCNPVFVSAVGTDELAGAALAHCRHMDMKAVQRYNSVSTATYAPILVNGQLLFGVADMDINSQFDVSQISELDSLLESTPVVLLDGNFTAQVIETVVHKCAKFSVPVWFEPTDLYKSRKVFETDAWKNLTFISPNLSELLEMYDAMCSRLSRPHSQADLKESSNLEEIVQASVNMCRDLVTYIPVVLLTLGKHGALLCHRFGDATHLLPLPSSQLNSQGFKAKFYPAVRGDDDSSSIVSVSGAGDCLASAFIAGMLSGLDIDECMKHGMAAAILSLHCSSAVPDTISSSAVHDMTTYLGLDHYQPLDVTDGHL